MTLPEPLTGLLTPAQAVAVIAALAIIVLASEPILNLLGLDRVRCTGFRWTLAVAALAVGARWVTEHTSWDPQLVHFAALLLGTLVTCAWLNEPAEIDAATPATPEAAHAPE